VSRDIYLSGAEERFECECEACGNEHIGVRRPLLWQGNLTYNLVKMTSEAGIYEPVYRGWEHGVDTGADMVPRIEEGYRDLVERREHYAQWNPPNGWGNVDILISVVGGLLAACREHPDAVLSWT